MQEIKAPKKLEILIGDDGFLEPVTMIIFKEDYAQKLKRELSGYEINIAYETNPQRVIEKGSRYDVIVTDLDYTGDGTGKQGYDVIDAISKLNPRPLIILCTSSDNHEEIQEKTQGKIDYLAGTGQGHKFGDLIDVLIGHYGS
ncbi:MAG: hypothetical protein Q8O89_04185 [Nanoarchaeota archaeon]|nr:hypothetical protein [Nanoarchaeota archaeon]